MLPRESLDDTDSNGLLHATDSDTTKRRVLVVFLELLGKLVFHSNPL